MTDYESIFRSQLEEMDFSGMEDILEAADLPQEITQSFSVKEIISNMLSVTRPSVRKASLQS